MWKPRLESSLRARRAGGQNGFCVEIAREASAGQAETGRDAGLRLPAGAGLSPPPWKTRKHKLQRKDVTVMPACARARSELPLWERRRLAFSGSRAGGGAAGLGRVWGEGEAHSRAPLGPVRSARRGDGPQLSPGHPGAAWGCLWPERAQELWSLRCRRRGSPTTMPRSGCAGPAERARRPERAVCPRGE
ncbi:hypothetical protein HJG60_008424 [Phyllostomus discolor]|uniref:Uncharacterized protein n=1 Tax=Phyllostomus discolor TaxID=89673 RepID=A0A833Z301_9CHIR|nr:hypothetical protein HJG60_008424 [Phyllostomus discolor]